MQTNCSGKWQHGGKKLGTTNNIPLDLKIQPYDL